MNSPVSLYHLLNISMKSRNLLRIKELHVVICKEHWYTEVPKKIKCLNVK